MPPAKLKFGPADHGRRVTADELTDAEYVECFLYEIIDGGFYVSPQPGFLEHHLGDGSAGNCSDSRTITRPKRNS
jgi:hypothetical protein